MVLSCMFRRSVLYVFFLLGFDMLRMLSIISFFSSFHEVSLPMLGGGGCCMYPALSLVKWITIGILHDVIRLATPPAETNGLPACDFHGA
jgi:hypothetical protein